MILIVSCTQLPDFAQIPQHLILYSQLDTRETLVDDEPLIYPKHNGIDISGLGIDQRATALEKIRLLHKKASKLVQTILKCVLQLIIYH